MSNNNKKETNIVAAFLPKEEDKKTDPTSSIPVEDKVSNSANLTKTGRMIESAKTVDGINLTGNTSIDVEKIYIKKCPYENEANLQMNSMYNFLYYNQYMGERTVNTSLKGGIKLLLSNTKIEKFRCDNDAKARSLIAVIRDLTSFENMTKLTTIQKAKAIRAIALGHNFEWKLE